jgi:hypothetical protein
MTVDARTTQLIHELVTDMNFEVCRGSDVSSTCTIALY